jgi:hypothetical protein
MTAIAIHPELRDVVAAALGDKPAASLSLASHREVPRPVLRAMQTLRDAPGCRSSS